MVTTQTKSSEKKDLVITRVFHAPLELVWKAWTDPSHVQRWWGPKAYTAPYVKMDFREGGKYHFCMRSSEGQDIYSTGVYRKIVPMELIECTDSFADETGNVVPATHYGMGEDFPEEMVITIKFKALGKNKTEMTLIHAGMPAGEMFDGANAGWNESFDKLEESLK